MSKIIQKWTLWNNTLNESFSSETLTIHLYPLSLLFLRAYERIKFKLLKQPLSSLCSSISKELRYYSFGLIVHLESNGTFECRKRVWTVFNIFLYFARRKSSMLWIILLRLINFKVLQSNIKCISTFLTRKDRPPRCSIVAWMILNCGKRNFNVSKTISM